VSLTKRFLGSRTARTLVGLSMRVYRAVAFAGFRLRHDPRLVALLRSREPAVFACWHQDFLVTMGYVSRFCARRRSYVLASGSRDGGLAAGAAEGVGFRRAARGSSAGGGASALRALARWGKDRPGSFAVVADGPRPPARVLKPGALHLAQRFGLPLWLVRTSWTPDSSMKRTWARFHAAPPGRRGVCLADGPISVAPDLTNDEFEAVRLDVERRLNALADRADATAARVWGSG
jgi:lysophospholipid acyltransferase (LPLAT)-like uncharacterized protein